MGREPGSAGGVGDGWEIVSASGLRRIYRLLCHVAHCDHELHPAERALLERYRRRFGIDEDEAALLEEEGKRKQIRLGRHTHEQHMLMWAMIDVAAADGRLDRSEHKRLLKVAGATGLPQAELVALIRRRFAHDRGGLPPRPPGVKTTVIPPAVKPHARREIPDTIGPIPTPLRGQRSIPPTAHDLSAPHGLDDLPPPDEPEDHDPFARAPGYDPFESVGEDARPTPGRGVSRATVTARSELPTPVPADPPRPLEPDFFGPHDTSLSLSPGAIVLLGLSAREVRIDLTTVMSGSDFRGFTKVPPGLHWVSVDTGEGPTSLWLDLPGGGVVVKVYDQRARRLVDAAPQTAGRYQAMARGGVPGLLTYPYDHAVEWVELTVHIDPDTFPPGLHPADVALADARATKLEAVIQGTHRGDGQAFLTEMSWAFLAGALDRHPAALERWLVLLKACFEAPPTLLAEDPAVAVLLVDLLVAQLQQMPPTFIDVGITTGAGDLAAALKATGLSHLLEAATRLVAGIEQARRG